MCPFILVFKNIYKKQTNIEEESSKLDWWYLLKALLLSLIASMATGRRVEINDL
jgi:hypothetical protein